MQVQQPPSSDLVALAEQLEATLRTAADVSETLLGRLQALNQRMTQLQAHAAAIRHAADAFGATEPVGSAPAGGIVASAERPGPAWPRSGPPGVLFIEVERRDGPLDLRAVDRPVSGHPCVADVALLDYDGRRARFKVWTRSSDEAPDVGAALEGSIRESLAVSDARVSVQAPPSAA